MKRNTRYLIFALLILSLALVLTNCGSSGGGGGGGGGGNDDVPTFDFNCTEAPTYNINGVWDVADTDCNTTQCPNCDLQAFTATITHDGVSNNFTFFVQDTGETFTKARICGNMVGIQGTTFGVDGCELGNNILIVGTLSSDSFATTGNAWTCSFSGGSCRGTSTSIASKR